VTANIVGPDGLIVLLVIVVMLFGAGQLPKLARSFGQAGKEFKKAQAESEAEIEALKAVGRVDLGASPAHDLGASRADDRVTLSKSELDALLAAREARARDRVPPTTA
jgi:TatA/E family protein of Tat protein translocase